ncbi:Vesicle-associated membrane protein 727 [Camellia lanceoleosa]|uniref:Vesicle-associated membrane protein 727 n=1 Tax=Camellia lanceoleosa TaxID=1840588 RepID=A0ACC0IUK1_9ERIC|nr:Vesicle-associated membrane protein 727 [Camellia lanceoleosa]
MKLDWFVFLTPSDRCVIVADSSDINEDECDEENEGDEDHDGEEGTSSHFGDAVFLVVANESVGRSVSFVFLERVKDDFKQCYGASIRTDDPDSIGDEDDDEEDDLFPDR